MYMKCFFLMLAVVLAQTLAMAQDKCLQLADSIVKYQSKAGGWLKNQDWLEGCDCKALDLYRKKSIGATIDNGATVSEMRHLVEAIDKLKEMEGLGFAGIDTKALKKREMCYQASFTKALGYLLEMQYDNGGFPQFYPQKEKVDYSIDITFNDNAMVNALRMLRDVAKSDEALKNAEVEKSLREKCLRAYERGVKCILDCQIRVDSLGKVLEYGTEAWKLGKKTVWCQQHDRRTLAPVKARAFELASYCGNGETCGILTLLMDIDNPSEEVKDAVRSAVEWLESHAMRDVEKETFVNAEGKKDVRLVERKGAPLLWARFYDLVEGEPFFCGRDGVPRRDLSDVEYERRNGYSWAGNQPAKIIKRYKDLNY